MEDGSHLSPQACAQAWKSFDIQPGGAGTNLLITCDHATNLLPPEYGTLGLDNIQLNRHIGYDIGVLGVARELGRLLGATVIWSRFSRLLIDPNRGDDDPTLIQRLSDGAIVPGNARMDAEERARRIAAYYGPYHRAIATGIEAMLARGLVPAFVPVHSFTDTWRGVPRKWNAAILWDRDPRLAVPMLRELRERTGLIIGENQPYVGHLKNDSVYRHATLRGLPNALVEIRQDQIRDAKGQREWADILADCLTAIFANPASTGPLGRVEFYGSKTGAIEHQFSGSGLRP